MPDYKVVISDPEAYKNMKVLKVKVIGDPGIPFTDKMKEQLELPIAKVNSKLYSQLSAKHNIIVIRMRRPDTGDKVKIVCNVQVDNNVPEDVVKVSLARLIDITGTHELHGEIFRAPAWQIRINDERTSTFLGLKIGDEVSGEVLGLRNVKLVITGGSDISGFPMRPDIPGPIKKRALLSNPPGFKPREEGERKRKTVRGNMVATDTVQINTMIKYE